MKSVLLFLGSSFPLFLHAATEPLFFDIGTESSPVGNGYVVVFADTVYSEQRGFGWDHRADRGFYSQWEVSERFREWHPNHAGPLPDAVLTDGVTCNDPIAFLVDVSPGQYWVHVTVGGYESPRHDMKVRINDAVVVENIDAWGRVWGSQGGSPTKTVKAVVEDNEGRIRIEFTYRPHSPDSWREYTNQRPEDGRLWYLAPNMNSIVAVRLRPWSGLPVWEENGQLHTSLKGNQELASAISLYNSRDLEGACEAARKIAGEQWLFAKACLYDWIAGNMAFHEAGREERLLEESVSILEAIASQDASNYVAGERLEMDKRYLLAIRYLKMFAYSWAERLTGINSYHRYWAAYDLCGPFTPDDPLYYKSQLLRGKVAYWNGREGGWKHCYALAREHFRILKERFRDDRLVRMYSGERVASVKKYHLQAPGAPEWAVKQREALSRISDLIRYWVEERQSENGELGGGWGDDVEILRSWGASVLAVDDPVAREGAEKIANGVWRSGIIKNGYTKSVGDVEHASEPVSDTQPLMVSMRYGDPLYIERCMETMRCMRDVWTGKSHLGHLHFRSHYYSATEVEDDPPRSADVALNGRAVKPGIWVVWYNNHPAVKSLLEDWSSAWVKDAMRTDEGKPAGIVPGSVSFPEDRIGGYSKEWWNTRGYFSNLAAAGYTASLYQIMLSVYGFGGDDKHVAPILSAMDAVRGQWQNPSPNAEVGSLPWVGQVHMARKFTDVVEKWRLLSLDTRYDDYLKERGSTYLRYLITGHKKPMISQLQGIVDALSSNIEMSTSEVLFTDRVSIPGCELIFMMMTGGVGDPTYYPLHAVTWENTNDRLAALVEKANDKRLGVLLYSFLPEEHEFRMRLWRLQPGEYEMTVSAPQAAGETDPRVVSREMLRIPERGTKVRLPLPPKTLCRVELQQVRSFPARPLALPDLAVGSVDLRLDPLEMRKGQTAKISLTVHNIGIAPAKDVTVDFLAGDSVFASGVIEHLEAPLDLVPRTATVTAEWRPAKGHHRIVAVVDPQNSNSEIAESNNRCSLEVSVH